MVHDPGAVLWCLLIAFVAFRWMRRRRHDSKYKRRYREVLQQATRRE